MSLTTNRRQNELLTEIEMDDREDSVDPHLQNLQNQLKPCYWSNLNREQKGKCVHIKIKSKHNTRYNNSCLHTIDYCVSVAVITHCGHCESSTKW